MALVRWLIAVLLTLALIAPSNAHAMLPLQWIIHTGIFAVMHGKQGTVKRRLMKKPFSRFYLMR